MSVEVEGIRVVRGPDWHYGDDDGGEGHVGTVTQDNDDNTVEVQWDMGNSGTYDTGNGGKCDLRVLDSAQLGWVHSGETCDSCTVSDFPGTRWRCISCSDVSLCTPCYSKDKHSIQHQFLRIDAPGMSGKSVPKRSISNKLRSLGLFQGAKVRRGVDWRYRDQDGGEGKVGSVIEVTNHGTAGQERDSVKVKWPNGDENRYRVGYKGKMDLLCIEQAPGMDYYREHLLKMSTQNIPKEEHIRNVKTITPKTEIKTEVKQTQPLQVGDKVCVFLPETELKESQRGHGGWVMRMASYIGKHGELKRFEDNGDILVEYDDNKDFRFNPKAVMKIPNLDIGDKVRINENKDVVSALQAQHGGWQEEMTVVLGKVGKVVKIDSDGDVAITFGNKSWVFNPACCEPAPGERINDLEDHRGERGESERRRYRTYREENTGSGGATGGGAEAGTGAGSKDRGEAQPRSDLAAEALAKLIENLYHRGNSARTVTGPQHLVSAAANNDVDMVTKILRQNPNLVDQKHKGLTALIISSHEGHKMVVKVLLQARASLDITEEKGHTALMAALMKKREEIAIILIEAGCDVNLADVQLTTALHFAARNGCTTTLRELLSKGADPNKLDTHQDTPLHDAILSKNDSIASFLIAEQRTNLKLCNQKGLSPLHLAAMKDDELTVTKLLARAPELKDMSRASDRYTALHIAAMNDNAGVIKVLLKARATVDSLNVKKYSPLHLSCHQGYVKSSKLLIYASANVNVQDEDGDTPLHNCVMGRRSGREEDPLVGLLLGIRVSRGDEDKERKNLACLLIQNGARTNIRNYKGRTPIECCSDGEMRNVIRTFAARYGSGNGGGAGASARPQTAAGLFANLLGLTQCVGCDEKIADTIFGPCRHQVCCKRCAFRVRQCPRCDKPITGRYDLEGRPLMIDPCKVQ